MLLFYVDESGNRDPRQEIPRKDGTKQPGDPLYVLTAVSLFEHKWTKFDSAINNHKRRLIEKIRAEKGQSLELADCELKSNWVRRPDQIQKHLFLQHLSAAELAELVGTYYAQLTRLNMRILSVIVDKRCLQPGESQDYILKIAWEHLLMLVEDFMRVTNPKHRAIMINEDNNLQDNRALAMRHADLLKNGTSRRRQLDHICEMPMFVRSELSNGVQLADMCSYNIYKAFRDEDLNYEYFQQISPSIWTCQEAQNNYGGIYLHPKRSCLLSLRETFETGRASPLGSGGPGNDVRRGGTLSSRPAAPDKSEN